VEPRPGRGSELYVQPAELARRLVDEMEDHKVSRAPHTMVPNRYTIFLCPEDHERLHGREDALIEKLERHLAKHVRSKRYDLPGEIRVGVALDEDLRFGHFGILAGQDASEPAGWDMAPRVEQMPPRGVTQTRPSPGAQAAPRFSGAGSPVPAGGTRDGATEVIRPDEATHMDLARQTLVIRAGNREREFAKGRVIVGRGRDVDFTVEDPNVSRRHAAIYWSDGKVVIEDLGSTNGTMVNGYPVSSTVVRPGDVIVIGDCRITVEAR